MAGKNVTEKDTVYEPKKMTLFMLPPFRVVIDRYLYVRILGDFNFFLNLQLTYKIL